jgi:hypothetical protein
LVLLVLQKRVQAVEARVPEFFVALQPIHRSFQRTALELTAHHAAGLAAHDEPGIFQNTEMLDESRQRHRERLRELADRTFAALELREHSTARGIGEGTENGVEPAGRIVNHKVKCERQLNGCQAAGRERREALIRVPVSLWQRSGSIARGTNPFRGICIIPCRSSVAANSTYQASENDERLGRKTAA